MEYALLRSLRALGPGLILLGYFDLIRLFVLDMPAYFWAIDSAKLFLAAYVIGGVYGVLASFVGRDRYAFDEVNNSTLAALQKIFPEANGLEWNEVSPCFYKLIDTDKSLEQQSKGLYFNGFIVTTSFDAIWLSVGAAVLGGGIAVCMSRWSFMIAAGIAVVISFGIWLASIKRHRELAMGQVNVIEKRLGQEFRDCIRGSVRADRAKA